MKLTVDKKSFAATFAMAAAGVPGRTTKDILKYVLLTINEQVTLRADDGEASIVVRVTDCNPDAEYGQVLLPADRLTQILRETTGESVQFETGEYKLAVTAGTSEFRLDVPDAQDFPPRSAFAGEDGMRVTASSLHRAIARTLFAVDVESTRYALGGLCFELESKHGKALYVVATDSRRLAIDSIKFSGEPWDGADSAVVPRHVVALWSKVFPTGDEEIAINVTANSVRASYSDLIVVTGQLVQGRFPSWRKVVPSGGTPCATIASKLAGAVRQAAITTDETARGVDLSFSPGLLKLTAGAGSIGASKVELPVAFEGEPVKVRIDPNWIVQAMRPLDAALPVTIHLTDGDSAVLLETNDGYRHVIMPIQKD